MKISNALRFITPLVLATSFATFAQTHDSKTIGNKPNILQGLASNTSVRPKSSLPFLDAKLPSKMIGIGKSLSRPAQGGVATGGGDAYSQSFVQTAWSIYNELILRRDSRVSLSALKEAIQTVSVNSTDDPLYLDGAEKDAINEPSLNRITINRKRWRENEQSQKKAVALHEYLRFLKVDDSKYQVSGPLLADLSKDATNQIIDALEDVRDQASLIFSGIETVRSEATCYQIAMLNVAISKTHKLIETQSNSPNRLLSRGDTERLDLWSSNLREFCLSGIGATTTGAYVKASDRSYKEYLLLVMRDSEILLSWISSQLQHTPYDDSEIWERYRTKISNL